MGMSTDMAPTYISMNPTGQMTYILETSNVNLAQLQLASPGSEIVLIQDDNKAINLCENPGQVEAAAENVAWLGNNVIVLVSQPQEYIVVEQEVVVDSNVVQSTPIAVANTQLAKKEDSDEFSSEVVDEGTLIEDAKCWFRDSLITTAALSKLTNYVQSNPNTKIG